MEYLTTKYRIIIGHAVHQEALKEAVAKIRHQPGCDGSGSHKNGCTNGPDQTWRTN